MRVFPPRGFRPRLLILLACMSPFALGCGDGRKPVFPVEGQVLVDGKPAARAVVTLHPVGDTSPTAIHPVGHVDDSGKFTLTSYREADGAPEGDYAATVTWFRATRISSHGDDYVSKNYLPQRYAQAETAQLHVRVSRAGPNNLEPFQLRTR